MSDRAILGIFREKSHSPMREYDDEAILKETAAALSERIGRQIPLLSPQEFLDAGLDFKPELIFYMCEEESCLKKLRDIRESMGCTLVNTVEAVENTFRARMLDILSHEEFFPSSKIISSGETVSQCPEGGVWLKRGDFHAIESEDVIFVDSPDKFNDALSRFAKRGIKDVVVQHHIEGDIIKFYSITNFQKGKEYWFKWFYHKEQDLKGYKFSETQLLHRCQKAGSLLGLEIFGGDAIVQPDGNIFVIDVNAWPSFALFRKEAARGISNLLGDKLDEMAGSVHTEVSGQQSRPLNIIPS